MYIFLYPIRYTEEEEEDKMNIDLRNKIMHVKKIIILIWLDI